MRQLIAIIQKEFQQIRRDPAIIRIIFMMPVVQLILIPLAADYEVRNINLSIVDNDHSDYSRKLIHKLEASIYFNIVKSAGAYPVALKHIEENETDVILTIPNNFEKNLVNEQNATVMLSANAISNTKAGLGVSYATQIIQDFANIIIMQNPIPVVVEPLKLIDIRYSNWYNPYFDYQLYIVPGILGILVTMVGSFLTALNIVREKEIGTIEQINVTPLKKYQFILGKLIPFWLISLLSITLGLVVSYVVFGLIPLGSYLNIYIFSIIYLPAVLGFGLLVSTLTDNQQQATLFAFFMMMIFVLMSGLYTPIESMPKWAQWIAYSAPPTYLVKAYRSIFIKGSSLWDLRNEIFIVIIFGIVINSLAIFNYKKRAS